MTARPVAAAVLAVVTLAVVGGGIVVVTFGVSGEAGTAAGHGTHVTVGPQVVAGNATGGGVENGVRVVVDAVNTARDGFLVVHRNAGGDPGEPIGSVAVSSGFHDDVAVRLEGDVPRDGEVLWAVVHTDDGDGRFDPTDDPPVESLGGIAGGRFPVRAGDRPVYVLTHDANAQPSNGSVRVARVATAEAGHLVVHADDRGTLGPAIGNVSLSAGVHRRVSVGLNESVIADQRRYFRLWAVVYVDDGDGRFDPGVDEPVSVGDEPVRARFPVEKVDRVPDVWRANGSTDQTGSPGTVTDRPGSTGGRDDDGRSFDPGFGGVAGFAAVALVFLVLWRNRRGG